MPASTEMATASSVTLVRLSAFDSRMTRRDFLDALLVGEATRAVGQAAAFS